MSERQFLTFDFWLDFGANWKLYCCVAFILLYRIFLSWWETLHIPMCEHTYQYNANIYAIRDKTLSCKPTLKFCNIEFVIVMFLKQVPIDEAYSDRGSILVRSSSSSCRVNNIMTTWQQWPRLYLKRKSSSTTSALSIQLIQLVHKMPKTNDLEIEVFL